eukprot:199777-Rhodomonas_salina.1
MPIHRVAGCSPPNSMAIYRAFGDEALPDVASRYQWHLITCSVQGGGGRGDEEEEDVVVEEE